MPRLEDKAHANGFDNDDDDEMTGEEKVTMEEVEKADIMAKYQEHCEMHERHFYCHMLENPDFAEEEKRCHYCQIRSFKTDATAKTSMVNHVKGDYHVIDADFVFIETSIVREGVEEPDDAALSGCSCTTRLECMKDSCSCLTEVVPPEEATDNSKINAYHGTGNLKGCLRRYWLDNNLPIYECSDKCSCDESCANRVVGRGRETSLQVFRTRDGRGWGLRSLYDIKKGAFVGSYVGEIITPEEANRRRAAANVAQRKDVYLFALDKFSDKESSDPKLRGDPYEIDGEFFSGPTRFINHSCAPNVRIFAIVKDLAMKHLHELAFFALEDIPRLTELTFDYHGHDHAVVDENDDEGDDYETRKLMTRCLCGAENCRGYIW